MRELRLLQYNLTKWLKSVTIDGEKLENVIVWQINIFVDKEISHDA